MAAIGNGKTIFGLQFHPEVRHTPQGDSILENFLFKICLCGSSWTPRNFVNDSINRVRSQVGDGQVICALSGGVDSAVTAVLLQRAIGDQLTCVFVNNGLMRNGETDLVQDVFQENFRIDLRYVDAEDKFLDALHGVTDPEQKRKIIGEEFIRVFEEEAAGLGEVDWGRFVSVLGGVGYHGPVCVEVEDRTFEDSLASRTAALRQSSTYLRQFIPRRDDD